MPKTMGDILDEKLDKRVLDVGTTFSVQEREKLRLRKEYLETRRAELKARLEARSFPNDREMANATVEVLELEKEMNATGAT